MKHPCEAPVMTACPHLDIAFERWLDRHPMAYEHFKSFALDVIEKGRTHFGAKAIVERIRWYVAFEYDGIKYRINNNYTSRLARKFMEEFPEHQAFFETRSLR